MTCSVRHHRKISLTGVSLLAALLLNAAFLCAQQGRAMPELGVLYPLESLQRMLVQPLQWHPYPTVSERDFWESLPGAARSEYI
ncbi:MAG: hypothetical protein JXQ83_12855, partial [Candidatus Glassbacteria bacterium]|nr:hypothetical protein [Candidatus Glassbacteria bacterium]